MASPVVEWKLNGFVSGSAPVAGGGKGRIRRVSGGGGGVVVVVGRSARKLAAALWRFTAVGNCGGTGGVTWHGQHGRFDQLQLGVRMFHVFTS